MKDFENFSKFAKETTDCVCLTTQQMKDLNHVVIQEATNNRHDIKQGFWVEDIVLNRFTVFVEDKIIFTFEPEKVSTVKADASWAVTISTNDMSVVGIMAMNSHYLRANVIVGEQDDSQIAVATACTVFSAIQNRLLYQPDNFQTEEKRVKKSSTKKKRKGSGQRKVRLFREYTLLRIDPVNFKGKKHLSITCPCWGVMGHYRHYKSGKVVFIQPYSKGKARDKYSPKEYQVYPKTKVGSEVSSHENH